MWSQNHLMPIWPNRALVTDIKRDLAEPWHNFGEHKMFIDRLIRSNDGKDDALK